MTTFAGVKAQKIICVGTEFQKARQIIWVYILINDNFRWSKNSRKIILIHIFSGLNLLKTRQWFNQETKVMFYNRTVLPVSDR